VENNVLNIVTGAFGYTGKYITQRLLSMNQNVKTLTNHIPSDNPFENKITAAPLNFNNPQELAKSMEGASTLYNTYWIRFPYKNKTYDDAVANTKVLVTAAKKAGIRRIVHISITNASSSSPLAYFKGKGIVEDIIKDSGISFAFLRPTLIFGKEDILINNIAWFLRKFPVFSVSGSGQYLVQPVFVDDVAAAAVDAGRKSENLIWDVAGPETFTFNELINLIKEKISSSVKIIHLPPAISLLSIKLLGLLVGDVILTKDEIKGLMSNLLMSNNPHPCSTKLSAWLSANAQNVGKKYTSELKRHYSK